MPAYLSLSSEPQIDSENNRFSIDGRRETPIWGGPNLYRIECGKHTVVVRSGTGDQWTVEADVGHDKMLTIKLYFAGRDICDVRYKVDRVQMFLKWIAKPLSY